jgi:CDP-diacylglycerol--glycerol-3-phosphate 3-phosphatidyltransferase
MGKLKTGLQIAAIMCLIAFDPAPTWVNVLLYIAVAVTVISGLDYFFGLRKRMEEHAARAGVDRRPAAE